MTNDGSDFSSRRGFLRQAGALAATAGLGACARSGSPEPPAPPAETRTAAAGQVARRTLGRTGLDVGVVAVGAGNLSGGPSLVRRAVTNGINYIDTSMCYMGGRSEEIVGQGVKGIRDQAVIATKWDANASHSKQQILAMLDASLKRLGTDHVDIILIHQLGDHFGASDTGFNRLENSSLYEAIAAAKKSGKARFAGASSHVGNRRQILTRAIETGSFDMILVSYNYSNFSGAGIPDLLKLCRQKNIGVVGMKTQQGNQKVRELAGRDLDLFQANLKWCLAQGCQTVINSQIGNSVRHQDLAIDVAKSDLKVAEAEHELLHQYAAAISADYCRGCGDICQSACPAGVRIADVLRYRMYHKHYGDTAQSVARYAALAPAERLTDGCGSCNLCTQACPHGLPVVEQLYESRALMWA